jgi:hypothetical protein
VVSGHPRHEPRPLVAALPEPDKLRQAYERLDEQHLLRERRFFVANAERIDVARLELEFA